MANAPTVAPEVKAWAQAFIIGGYPATQVALALGLPARTVQHWSLRWRTMARDEGTLIDGEYRIAQRAQELTHDILDALTENRYDDPILKFAGQLNYIRGTAADKVLASRSQQQNTQILIQLVPESQSARIRSSTEQAKRITEDREIQTEVQIQEGVYLQPPASKEPPGSTEQA